MSEVAWEGWQIGRVIGKGSFGEVYEIERDVFDMHEKAALKVISIPHDDSEVEELLLGSDRQTVQERYKGYLADIVREYSIMSRLKGNTNIVDCDDLKYEPKEDGFGWNIYIKMELLTPLTKKLRNGITESEVIKLGIDICNALVLCNKNNIIHRDIKPQNIFVSDNGDYKLGDFGIAKRMDHTTVGSITGTYKYMAPEVYNNEPYNERVDIYSLGLVMYSLLNKHRMPFLPLPPKQFSYVNEEEAKIRRFSGEKIPEPADGSDALKRIVCKACEFSQNDRYTSAKEMMDDLKALTLQGQNEPSFKEKSSVRDELTAKKEPPVIVEYPVTEKYSVGAGESEDRRNINSNRNTEKVKPASGEHVDKRGNHSEAKMKNTAKQKKPVPAVKIIIALAAVIGIIVAAVIIGNGQKKTASANPPTQRVMMSDTMTLLREEDIDGVLAELEVVDENFNQKFKTYTVECEIKVNSNGQINTYGVELIYDLENNQYSFSKLSKIIK